MTFELRKKIATYSRGQNEGVKVADIEKKFHVSGRCATDHLKAIYEAGILSRDRISGTGFTYFNPNKSKKMAEAKAENKAIQDAKNRRISNRCSERAKQDRRGIDDSCWHMSNTLYEFIRGFEGQYPERVS